MNRNSIKSDENIRKNAACQGHNYTTGCILDYLCIRENHKLISIDLTKEQAIRAD